MYDRSTDEQKFVLYRRTATGAWQGGGAGGEPCRPRGRFPTTGLRGQTRRRGGKNCATIAGAEAVPAALTV